MRRFCRPLTAALVLVVSSLSACASDGAPPAAAVVPPPAPIVLGTVTPSTISARGGEILSVAGSGFSADTVVTLDGVKAAKTEVLSPISLRVTAPPLFAGSIAAEASGAGGTARLANAIQVTALELRFVQAPTYSLTIAGDPDAGADAGPSAGDAASPAMNAGVTSDLDGDGDVDMVSCAAGEACHFLANDGQGNFDDTARTGDHRFGSESKDARLVALIDVDGDGAEDLVVSPKEGAPVVEVNDGHARFSPTALPWGPSIEDAGSRSADGGAPTLDSVTAIATGDLDGDGKPELVLGHAGPGQTPLRILKNVGGGGAVRFAPSADGMVPARDWPVRGIAMADVDRDGDVDLVLSTPDAADGVGLRLLLASEAGFTEAHGGVPDLAGASVAAIVVADVTGDGAADIVAVGKGQDRLLINDGSGHFFDASKTSMPLDDTTATSVALVDLDRDRDLDLVVGNRAAVTRLYLNDGKGVFHDATPLLPLVAVDAAWVTAADVDGDSDQDILIVSAAPMTPRLYLSVEPSQ